MAPDGIADYWLVPRDGGLFNCDAPYSGQQRPRADPPTTEPLRYEPTQSLGRPQPCGIED